MGQTGSRYVLQPEERNTLKAITGKFAIAISTPFSSEITQGTEDVWNSLRQFTSPLFLFPPFDLELCLRNFSSRIGQCSIVISVQKTGIFSLLLLLMIFFFFLPSKQSTPLPRKIFLDLCACSFGRCAHCLGHLQKTKQLCAIVL